MGPVSTVPGEYLKPVLWDVGTYAVVDGRAEGYGSEEEIRNERSGQQAES